MNHSHIFIKLLQAVWLMQMFGANAKKNTSQSHCTTGFHMITCNGSVPEFVPRQIHSVEITQLKDRKEEQFQAISTANWTHIKSLTIKCALLEMDRFTVPNITFTNFSSLKFLKISCQHLEGISKDVFLGLDNLIVLDLSDCFRLSVKSMTAALEGDKLQSLQQLTLRRLSLFLTSTLLFSKEFFYSLRNKPIHRLDLSGTKYGSMNVQAFAECLPQLTDFNVSDGGLLAMNLMKGFHDYGEHFQKLQKVDISYLTVTDSFVSPANRLHWQFNLLPAETFVQNLTSVYVQGFVPRGIGAQLEGLAMGKKLCVLIVILPLNIRLTTFCLLQDKSQNIHLQSLNLALNGLQDIDPFLTSRAVYLRYLNLSHNRINRMLYTRFEKCLYHTTDLVEVYITHNSLSDVPFKLFINTKKLQVIDMSNNNLESVTFKLDHLHDLRFLNLEHNKIHTINAQIRGLIDQLINVRTIQRLNISYSGQELAINMRSNLLACSCGNKEFIEWIISTKEIRFNSVCSVKGARTLVRHKVMSKIDDICKRPIIIGSCSAAGSVLLIIGVIVSVVYFHRRRVLKKKKHLVALIEKYEVNGNFKYPVFLSYSSADEDFIVANVVDKVNKRLQVLLETSKNCVATGDTTFRPGFYVLEEVIKWIECSEVVILCISNNFCKSPWCKDEMFVSMYQHKPIVLMFLEEVKMSEMPKVLQTYFSNTTRSKWVREGDDVKLVPCWDTVCQSIVDLMTPETTDS